VLGVGALGGLKVRGRVGRKAVTLDPQPKSPPSVPAHNTLLSEHHAFQPRLPCRSAKQDARTFRRFALASAPVPRTARNRNLSNDKFFNQCLVRFFFEYCAQRRAPGREPDTLPRAQTRYAARCGHDCTSAGL